MAHPPSGRLTPDQQAGAVCAVCGKDFRQHPGQERLPLGQAQAAACVGTCVPVDVVVAYVIGETRRLESLLRDGWDPGSVPRGLRRGHIAIACSALDWVRVELRQAIPPPYLP